MSEPRAIFVRAPNWVGDVVMATGVIRRLRELYPAAKIVVGARGHLHGLLAGEDGVDELIETPKAKGWAGVREQARRLKPYGFDLAVLLPNSLETALVAWSAGIPRRIGYRQGRSLWITDGPRAVTTRPFWRFWNRHGPRRVPEPMPEYYGKLLETLGHERGETFPRLSSTPEDRAAVDQKLRDWGALDRPLVLFTAGASFGASKLWPKERFAEVARAVVAKGHAAVFLAGPAEIRLVEEIAQMAPGVIPTVDPILPFGELKALVERASLMVSTDTGPRHLAVAFGIPVVCVMGPTDPRYTNYGLEKQVVIRRAEMECVPCQKKVCPLGHHDCLRSIESREVLTAMQQLGGPEFAYGV